MKAGDEYEASKQVQLNLGIANQMSEQGLLLDKVDQMPKRRRMTLKIKTKDQR